MDVDWREVSRVALPGELPHTPATPLTALAFDVHQDLIWTGNDFGRVKSFYGSELQRYTGYRGHDEGPVRSFLFSDRGVVSLGPKSIHVSHRRGLAKAHIMSDRMFDLRCMSYTSKGTSEVIAGGIQKSLLTINLDRGTVINEIPSEDDIVLMRRDRVICCGTATGSVNIIDPNSFKIIKTIRAHGASVSDIDAQNNILLTCGYSPRQSGYVLDPLVNIYDLRTFRSLPPVPFPAGAAFCRMHPKMSTTGIVASQTGQFQIIDIANPNVVNLRQANVSNYISSLELAPTGDALALADADAILQLWGKPDKMRFTELSNPVEWPSAPTPRPNIDFNENTPLSAVGMPYYREPLLSAWPSHMVFDVGKPPPKIDPEILAKMKMHDFVGYAPNPRRTRRYQVESTKVQEKPGLVQVPKFRSEKAREGESEVKVEEDDAPWNTPAADSRLSEVPAMYHKVEIKYSKFGVDDFDFEFYNKTKYSGLETHITNSYSNPLLQLLKFTPLIRNYALHHTARNCLSETCLLCELGFLFDMLDKANGQNCQATNFLKTFSSISQASAMGLFEEGMPRSNQSLSGMIQSLNRFLMEKIAADFKSCAIADRDELELENALITSSMTCIKCSNCGTETMRPSNSFVRELAYPKKGKALGNFSSVLKHSIERDGQTRGWCDKCRRYLSLTTKKVVQEVQPRVLMFNAAAVTQEAKMYWAEKNWLPREIGIVVQDKKFLCYQGAELNRIKERNPNVVVYELVGLVAEITGEADSAPHLVGMIDVSYSSVEGRRESSWHLFNDFLVRPVSQSEAMNFAPSWKLPSILCFQQKAAANAIDNSWKQSIDTGLLFKDIPLAPTSERCRSLTVDESPMPGTIVAIDAEFVALQKEEIEVKADGTRETIRPSRLSLARVSVLRGHGEGEGTPFIDDYIHTREPVVDYLTLFSGIEPGDLDPALSKHALVSLKVAYKKLWILVNLGCVFVGHGLLKDFRIINIHVPKEQVIDTVDIYFKKARQRKLSLRFLAYYFLRENIQTGNHDSIEDANTALRLYKKYLEFEDAGVFERMLNAVYQDGKLTNFKPPGENEAALAAAAAAAEAKAETKPGGPGAGGTMVMHGLDGNGSRPITPADGGSGINMTKSPPPPMQPLFKTQLMSPPLLPQQPQMQAPHQPQLQQLQHHGFHPQQVQQQQGHHPMAGMHQGSPVPQNQQQQQQTAPVQHRSFAKVMASPPPVSPQKRSMQGRWR
ncbi:poly(A)-specific ribonuclease [Orbilia brochopaga]|uniref:PAN2-PAN3 deadenylation complex catalytic subunit PAN2 n=1 Tax=Orbilia brochopaga TaxID=3140254 RepID=A0AAV9V527_9PEZI